MGIQIKNIGEYNKREDVKDPSSLHLTKEEIEYLLMCMSNGMFRGQDVEILFNLVLKLQQMYLSIE